MAKVLILIADDDPDVRLLSRANFEFVGFDVIEASSGMEALYVIRDGSPDVVVLDIMMPDVDGLEVLRVMREEQIDIPVVLLTGFSEHTPMVQEALSLGVEQCLVKPFSPTKLLHATMEALGINASSRQTRRLSMIEHLRDSKDGGGDGI